MTIYTFDEATLSDLHKEAHGYRPTAAYKRWWSTLTDDQKETEWDSLMSLAFTDWGCVGELNGLKVGC